jgi:enhancing lycopene biosynthesis protein 2
MSMYKKAAIILSGCGFLDGTEIHETTLLFLALARHGIKYQCFAPDREILNVISHRSKKAVNQKRNILEESARISRGNISDIKELKVDEYDILAIPGGFGVAANLSNFGELGEKCIVDPDITHIIIEFHEKKKPIIAICIAPVIVAKALEGNQITMTLGTDCEYIDLLNRLGMRGKSCKVNECCVDPIHKMYTCPGYMEPPNIAGIFESLEKAIGSIC